MPEYLVYETASKHEATKARAVYQAIFCLSAGTDYVAHVVSQGCVINGEKNIHGPMNRVEEIYSVTQHSHPLLVLFFSSSGLDSHRPPPLRPLPVFG